ncbi:MULTISPECIES: hypothetical protein [unclassified Anabaena]|uniref:hypothetical protein n=1 Tax=unclassified Anabaena TaxID=2619674 RepID=UPI0014474E12|nr:MULTISPECIES: hypothetical protein [unclassified Anabaena]MTJ07238.1 hypothetical protein [Anabaena sp. UHCC 0204]MTJ55212.1 hypothetical protein [Anabaena sp. UHCC 0253]
MTMKELIQAEIDKIPEQELNEVYQLIKDFTDKKNSTKKGILSQLKQIKIQGPTDFSVNFDKYSYQQELDEQ